VAGLGAAEDADALELSQGAGWGSITVASPSTTGLPPTVQLVDSVARAWPGRAP
jgi:hypothetical protein